jgi:hypothetical protein
VWREGVWKCNRGETQGIVWGVEIQYEIVWTWDEMREEVV